MLRIVLALLLATSLCGCQRAFFTAINTGTDAPANSLRYAAGAGHGLDIFAPQDNVDAPVVLFIYGGRWQGGHRQDYGFVGEALAAHGVLALVADYRQFPDVRFPVFVEDAALAVRWARDHAREFGGDPDRLFVVGHSAGAHIGALLATDARYLHAVGMQPRDIAGFVGIAGAYDFLPLKERDLQQIFGPPSRWAESQPVNFVDGDETPTLLLHGTDDRLVWPRNSASLQQKLASQGVEVEYKVYPGLGHIRILSAFRFPSLAPTLQDTLDFIRHRPPVRQSHVAPH